MAAAQSDHSCGLQLRTTHTIGASSVPLHAALWHPACMQYCIAVYSFRPVDAGGSNQTPDHYGGVPDWPAAGALMDHPSPSVIHKAIERIYTDPGNQVKASCAQSTVDKVWQYHTASLCSCRARAHSHLQNAAKERFGVQAAPAYTRGRYAGEGEGIFVPVLITAWAP
jgi:hypothetical protein